MGGSSEKKENSRPYFEAENAGGRSSVGLDLLSILREFSVFGNAFRSRQIEYLSSHSKNRVMMKE